MFFIVLHVETIFQSSQLSKIKELNALIDELIQCAQTALKKRKETIIIVEGNDTLKDLIHAPYFIYAEFKQDVFEILLEKQAPGTDYLIWINHHGKIVSINSDWKTPLNDERISEEIEHMHAWKQHALYVSRKTDALILKINPFSQTFDVVSQGHIVVGLNMEALISNLKQQPFHASKKVTAIDLHQASQKSIYSKLHRET